jgi:hypothetical protein
MLSYLWNFGNGNISLSEHPAPQVYTTPGDYIVHYTAWNNVDTTNVFTLTNVHINSMSNYGNSFPSYENADAYFKLFQNGTLIYQSNIIQPTPMYSRFGRRTIVMVNPISVRTITWEVTH